MRRLLVVLSCLLGSLAAAAPATADMPSGRTAYRTLADYEADIARLTTQQPGLARPVGLPRPSLEGRLIPAVEIAGGVGASDGRPVMVLLGVQHGDQWPAGELAMEWALDLVAAYPRDENVRRLLDAVRIVVVPVVNPDGFVLSRSAGPLSDFAGKRRNCRVQDGRAPSEGECGEAANRDRGVDLDRNFGMFWGGTAASGEPTAETYRGAAPFSEPESANVRDLVASRLAISVVATGATGGAVLRPPALRTEGPAPDDAVMAAVADAMAAAAGSTSLPAWQRSEASGTALDWSYFTGGALSLSVAPGLDEAQPAYDEVADAYAPTRAAYLAAARATADAAAHSTLTGRAPKGTVLRLHKDVETPTALGAPFSRDVLDATLTVGDGNRFEWHITPSTRPYALRERRSSGVAAQPARSVNVSSPAPPPPGRAATFEIEVRDDARRQLRAAISGRDGDDYDLVLYAGAVAEANRIASSAAAGAEEALVVDDPVPGRYVLEVRNQGAIAGFSGSLAIYGAQPGTEAVFGPVEESWTLTCETANGIVVARRKVDVRRGQRKHLGEACRTLVGAAGRLDLRVTARRTGSSRSVARNGLRVQVTCSRECELSAAAVAGKTVVARSAVTRAAGRRVVRLRTTGPGRRLLRRNRSTELTVTVFARDRAGTVVARSARVTLRR
jgi:hypothetical protein